MWASADSGARKDRARPRRTRLLPRRRPDLQARPGRKESPVATARRDRRALKALRARKERPDCRARAASLAQPARWGRKAPPGLQDRLGLPRHKQPREGSRDRPARSAPRARRGRPGHKARKVWRAIRAHRALKERQGRAASLDRPDRRGLSEPQVP
ncbi:hypothetical protein MicloDRAFT_00007170 [Microvirga lotononidis]|uniref:Uncharacterized protein n=1 Tax=Microvirga lotononidis TaxID=864069 RepID=I4Z2M6_9HYPH|nr:hypothetical protein MicloDRAFT_00007170 [Microvirga lotononidis]